MTLHIFNPEHDIALAANLSNFTAPLAGRLLRHDLAFLPALWVEEGDLVLVDDVETAVRSLRELSTCFVPTLGTASTNSRYDEYQYLVQRVPIVGTTSVGPWGWDRALCAQLKRMGVHESLLPSDDWLQRVRELSHRRTAARLLPYLQMEGTVGEAFECSSVEDVAGLLQRYERLVLKAPWSSSGRGVRFLAGGEEALKSYAGWLHNILKAQGSIMVEPRYEKVMDFAMEFTATETGTQYEGLSLFATNNGAYTGNILATEEAKRELISRYYPVSLLDNVREKIISCLDLSDYQGPFGIDMMFVSAEDASKTSRLLLHPCVEINLRRTMGHVALALTKRVNPQADDSLIQEMTISFDGSHYRLSCQKATAAAAATLSESTP